MIISHKYKFIFLKTNKTAGTSIEIALSKFCGPDDILTTISPEDEKIRQDLGYQGGQHYPASFPRDYSFKDIVALLLRGKSKPRFYSHITAKEVKAAVGEEIWNHYFKFCVERNPWDRAVSYYYWRCQSDSPPTFPEFLDSKLFLQLKRRGFEVYTINGQIAVDKICHYEDLATELEAVRVRLGIPEKLELPRAKSGFRKDTQGYREVFGEAETAKIETLFADEIRLFDYKF